MIRETYKGRKIKVVKGRGADFGYSRVTLNGLELGKYMGDESKALRSVRGTIDHADEVGINGDRYRPEWYAPGTYELCDEGHAKEISGECLHSWCVKQRTAAEPVTPERPRHGEDVTYRAGRSVVRASVTSRVDGDGKIGVINYGDRNGLIHYVAPTHLTVEPPDLDKLHGDALVEDELRTTLAEWQRA